MQLERADKFAALWDSSNSPPDVIAFLNQNQDFIASEKLAVLLLDQQRRWKTPHPLKVEDYLDKLSDLASDPQNKLQLAVGEFQARQDSRISPSIDEFVIRFPDIGDTLRSRLSELAAVNSTVDMSMGAELTGTDAAKIGVQPVNPTDTTNTYRPDPPLGDQRLGRYRLVRLLGEGAFGRVWLGQDADLQRYVAIKVPTPERFQKPEDAEAYLAEARTVARLNHPHIVPVHDVGRTDDGSIYVVSQFIEGRTLGDRIKKDRPNPEEAARLLATIAEALHYAHLKRLIHRDVKPANILLEDATGNSYLADFGLAIREEDYLRDGRIAGTPAYMSPEQARGEGHRLDGRSDVFSLGVVFYEMLTGKRPFRGSTTREVLQQVVSLEPVPPCQVNGSTPPELERICLKALSKRASDRYATAEEFADDLNYWNQTPQQEHKELQIVPKGLRSFDANDADFFLDLLPGPRNRDGLPESIQFWKTRIEETDSDKTFSVGLIYGPSGCGKSSLVKAGLLPRLSKKVIAVYVEATPDETEARILNGLRKQVSGLPKDLGLVETFIWLRRHEGRKVVVVLDQFEQWLHAHQAQQQTELVSALRQCDGETLQAMVMVRDDFAMAATRFMDSLDIPIVQGLNFATVDLFDVDHAQKVLIKFGQAFGKLPAKLSDLSDKEREFVRSVANGLANVGKVVSVRLALFAEMVKGKPWIPATLEEVGGTEGIGVNFLEETFVSRSANPSHRLHQTAARQVLKSLLPESGTDIKGHMQSRADLLKASGYGNRPKDFNDLIRILDSEIRLITPTDPEDSSASPRSGEKYYQLTHDYLVPSLRDWLTRKQKETRHGRAELLLADRAGVWNSRPENRQLPSLLQWSQIRWWTQKKNWTLPQRKMMVRAGKYHAIRGTAFSVLLAVTTFTGLAIRGHVNEREKATHAAGLVQAVINADTGQVPKIIKDMAKYRNWTDPLLRQENDKAATNSSQKLHASLALLPVDATLVDYLYDQLLDAKPNEVPVVRDALAPHKEALLDKLWAVVETLENDKNPQRLRAASALAKYDPESERWAKVQEAVGNDLVNVPAVYLTAWMESLRPVRVKLLGPLSEVYRTASRKDVERSLATDILTDYAADQPQVLADLLMDADDTQFAKIYAKFMEVGERGLPVLADEIDKTLPSDLPSSDETREKLAKRQANAAVALLKMDQPKKVWPLLKHSPDPRLRSYLIHRMGPLGVDAKIIIKRLDEEPDISIRRALLLSLGEFAEEQLPVSERTPLIAKLLTIYKAETDSGLHGAAEWLLRQWGEKERLQSIDITLRTDESQLETVIYVPLTAEQTQHFSKLSTEIVEIKKQIIEYEQSLPVREQTWERKRLEQSLPSPDSLNEGLVAYYPLDEAEGLKIANAVSGQMGGTYQGPETGKPEWVQGVLGRALKLDGTGTVVGGKPLELEGDQPFSYGCWFRYDSNIPMILLSSREQTKGFRGFDLSLENDHQLRVQIAGEDPNLPDNQRKTFSPFLLTVFTKTTVDPKRKPGWHHVMVTYDGSTKAKGVSIFVDGDPQPTNILEDNFHGTIKSTGGFHIGSRQWPSYRFRGVIDDVRIYNRCLAEQEVQQIFESGVQAVLRIAPKERTFEQQRLIYNLRPSDELPQLLAVRLVKAEKSLREAASERKLSRLWYVNGQGQTLAVIPGPVEFLMGSPTTEAGRLIYERQHKKRIARTFAIAAKSVTKEQFLRFVPTFNHESLLRYPDPSCPIGGVTWYEAAAYCNWLSKEEGIPKDQWCYEITGQVTNYNVKGYLNNNYLSLAGYRLPTEAEMEYATRGGALTSRYFGETEDLLPHYEWYNSNSKNRTWAVGSLKPNDLGLFDMQGNLSTWCQTFYTNYPQGAETSDDKEDYVMVNDTDLRVLRGHPFVYRSSSVRSANRSNSIPSNRNGGYGFRLARTLPPVPLTALSSPPEGPKGGEIEKANK